MEQLKAYVHTIFDELSPEVWAYIEPLVEIYETPKNMPLIRPGQIEEYFYFLKSGTIRFVIPDPDNEITFGFAFSNEFVSAYDSLLLRQPCDYQIETLTPCVIARLHRKELRYLYENTTVGNHIGRVIAENLFIKKKNREMSLLTKSAEERYDELFTKQPQIIKEIPLKYIASYIGITPQALSRIRKRQSKPL